MSLDIFGIAGIYQEAAAHLRAAFCVSGNINRSAGCCDVGQE